MKPGEHIAVIGQPQDAIEARRAGLHLRDTLLILLPGRELFAYLFRAPLEGTVADNVLKYGCGGLNIDGCRVGTGEDKGVWPITDRQGRTSFNSAEDGSLNTPVETDTTKGRWPTNLLLVHGPECVKIGEKRIKPSAEGESHGKTALGILNDDGWKPKFSPDRRPWIAPDGLETIDDWDCQPDCPVRLLDEQSGTLKSGEPVGQRNCAEGYGGNIAVGSNLTGYGDSGGASRFFPQFKTLPEALNWIAKLISTTQHHDPA